MKKDTKMTTFIDYTYIIAEMVDSIEQSIDRLTKVINETTDLLESLEKLNDNKFFNLIEQLKIDSKEYARQKNILTYRLRLLNDLRYDMTIQENHVISMLLESLGIANKEAKSVEERIQNNEIFIELKQNC